MALATNSIDKLDAEVFSALPNQSFWRPARWLNAMTGSGGGRAKLPLKWHNLELVD